MHSQILQRPKAQPVNEYLWPKFVFQPIITVSEDSTVKGVDQVFKINYKLFDQVN
jgi:hypothetical protein